MVGLKHFLAFGINSIMQFSRLKELVKKLGGVLVLDGDRPEFVILSYDKYENMEAGEEIPFLTKHNGLAQPNGRAVKGINEEEEQVAVERLNQEILALKEEIRQREEAELSIDEQSTEAVAQTVDFD